MRVGTVAFSRAGTDRLHRCLGVAALVDDDLLGRNTFDEGVGFKEVDDCPAVSRQRIVKVNTDRRITTGIKPLSLTKNLSAGPIA
jgi:hypothetical protein